METYIGIALEKRDVENVQRLIHSIERHVEWDKHLIGKLAKLLAYNKDQLAIDVKSLIILSDKIAKSEEATYDRTRLEGWC